jgi:glutamate/tyrosine decarboxylase-like PLP-dependent enzyme
VERHCALARRFAAALGAEPGVAVLNQVKLNQVIIRFGAGEDVEQGDALTREVIARVQQDGICFAGGARWRGLWVMRLSVISWPTTEADVDLAARAIIGA